ncbi:hypothetical protein OG413_31165 [Streptomyces sp. NBC_01433]|uniref:hypothetical protein n=1 Tax=Streptomyces sp. NBC_01433 TaxID=2903864 RepID=UPI002250CA76|nr:hypothetical protein [Streptomyces sp. NBC_01433]MCX4679691.1 hypothetical protein [Streptomyces sp. NBC_01433]
MTPARRRRAPPGRLPLHHDQPEDHPTRSVNATAPASGLYAGIALAGAIGGGTVNAFGGTGVLAVASIAGVITIAVMALSVRRYPSSRHTAEGDTVPEKAVTP